MTPAQHTAQRNMVIRSLLLAPTSEERGEERPRKPRRPQGPPVVTNDQNRRAYLLPLVNEVSL